MQGAWEAPAEDDIHIAWARDFWSAMRPFSSGGTYVNFLTEDADEERGVRPMALSSTTGWPGSRRSTIRTTCSARTRTSGPRARPDCRAEGETGPCAKHSRGDGAAPHRCVSAPIGRKLLSSSNCAFPDTSACGGALSDAALRARPSVGPPGRRRQFGARRRLTSRAAPSCRTRASHWSACVVVRPEADRPCVPGHDAGVLKAIRPGSPDLGRGTIRCRRARPHRLPRSVLHGAGTGTDGPHGRLGPCGAASPSIERRTTDGPMPCFDDLPGGGALF